MTINRIKRLKLKPWITALAICAGLALPTGAEAQSAAQVAAARARLRHEPTASECVQRALRYFRVTPEALDSLRSRSRSQGLLPTIALGYRYDKDQLASFANQFGGADTFMNDFNSDRAVHAASAGLIFDFRNLVFNAYEVQTYGVVGIQRDVLVEVTRAYYLRRQLLLRLLLRPPEDPMARAALELHIEEYTALLDSMTGGWFARTLAASQTDTGE